MGGTGRIGGTERNDAAKRVTEAADVGKADTATQQNDKTAEASPPVAGEAAPPAAIEVPSTADKPARPLEKPTIVIPADRASGPASSAPNDTSAAKEALKKRLKRIRQRLVQKKHEWVEGDSGPEKPGGSAVGKSRAAKWLLDMQRQQAKGGNGVALESAAGELVKVGSKSLERLVTSLPSGAFLTIALTVCGLSRAKRTCEEKYFLD